MITVPLADLKGGENIQTYRYLNYASKYKRRPPPRQNDLPTTIHSSHPRLSPLSEGGGSA